MNFGCGTLSSNGATYSDAFLVKYSASGGCLWSKRLGGRYRDKGFGVAVDANNNVLVTGVVDGYFTGTMVDFGGGPVTMQRDEYLHREVRSGRKVPVGQDLRKFQRGHKNQPYAVAGCKRQRSCNRHIPEQHGLWRWANYCQRHLGFDFCG